MDVALTYEFQRHKTKVWTRTLKSSSRDFIQENTTNESWGWSRQVRRANEAKHVKQLEHKRIEWRQADTTRKEQCKKKSMFQTNLEPSVTTVWKRCGDERRKKPVLQAAQVNEWICRCGRLKSGQVNSRREIARHKQYETAPTASQQVP